MDIITIDKTNYKTGTVINNLDSVLWVERYLEPGEFKIVCDPFPEILSALALGTFISHTDTTEVMVVENHEISEKYGQSSKVEISGRSLDCFLEKRIVSVLGTMAFNTANGNAIEFSYKTTPSAFAAYVLTQFLLLSTLSSNNIVPNISIILDSTIPTVSATERSIKKGANVYKEVYEVLKGADLGIRFERPAFSYASVPLHHYDSVNDPSGLKMALYVHTGVDRSSTVLFDYNSGDIESAKYLWSNKDEINFINAATSYAETLTSRDTPALTGWANKTGYVDVTSINTKVAGNAAELIRQADVLAQRTADEFSQTKTKTIVEPTISKNTRYIYRNSYLVGDLVYVIGNYGVSSKMRVIENIETQDENGYASYPTLAPL